MQAHSEEPSDRASTEVRWHFGSFIIWETQHRLERVGEGVRLGPRSFDLLLQLVKRAGEFVSKEELLSSVWAGVVVEEASVRVHMSMLRKALGEPQDIDDCREWISNVPLRGYRFNGRARREVVDTSSRIERRPPAPSFTKLPVRLTELVGREADVESVLTLLDTHRLVTIVGTGGIGKTSVAIRAAECHQLKHAAQIAFVDLSPLISQVHVLSTIARPLGVAADAADPIEAITQCLTGRDVLLLIDNCEHVVDSLAPTITGLLTALPRLRILATSREALRVSCECVLRLSALAVPDSERITLAQAMRWPSVKLLVARAKAAGAGAFNESHGPLLSRISRQFDGIPLAIELVAARLGVQSVGDLALRLDDHIQLFSIGNRGALPRHRTLAAALDWSIALLDEKELRLFRRLSVFRGRFDVESALRVAADMDSEKAFDALISLASKSLVSFDSSDAIAPYRLLDTTRSYAGALLAQSDEHPSVLRRHALLMLDLMKAATAQWQDLSKQTWGERYAHRLNDVRFALEVCLVQQADAKTAASLVIASGPLWFHGSQVAEYRDRVAAALRLVEQQPEPDTETATALNTALMIALLHTGGSDPELNAACDHALAGALTVNNRVLELQARWGRCTHDMFRGEQSAALRHSETLLELAQSSSDPGALNLAHRVSAMASHFCGKFSAARQHSEASIRMSRGSGPARANMVGMDPIVAAQAMLCRTLWVQGETIRALETASDAVARAESAGHAVSLCAALYGACPVALWSGELELASKWIHMMMEEAKGKGLVRWHRYAEWYFEGLQLGFAHDRCLHVREVSNRLAGYDAPRKEMLVTFCTDWVDDEMVERVARGEGLWSASEVWRAVGWRHEQRGMTNEAEGFYLRAIKTSRQQGAVAWELRAALSLARMRASLGRQQEAAQLPNSHARGRASHHSA